MPHPTRVQRLLAIGDADLVRDDMKLRGGAQPLTRFRWRPDSSSGCGSTAGRRGGSRTVSRVGVFLAYASASMDRPAIVPAPGVGGRPGSGRREAGVAGFRQAATGPANGRAQESPSAGLLQMRSYGIRPQASGCGWSREGIPHVLAIRSNEKLWVLDGQGHCVRCGLPADVDRLTVGLDQMQCGRWGQATGLRLGRRGNTAASRARATGCWPGCHCPARAYLTYALARPERPDGGTR